MRASSSNVNSRQLPAQPRISAESPAARRSVDPSRRALLSPGGNCRHVRGGAASRAALLVGHVVLPVWRDGHVHRRTPSAARTGRGRSGAGTQDAEPTPYQEAIPALVVRRGSICLQPRFEVRWFGPRGPAAQPRPITSESTRSPHRASALRRHVAGGVSGSPRAVGWRQGSAPGASFWSGGGDASGALQASCPPAFPPHHRPRGGALERPLAA